MLRIYKAALVDPLCLPLLFEKSCPEKKYFGLYTVTLLLINRFMNFWTQNYVDFSRGGDGIDQNQQFRTQEELNAKIQAG